MTKDADDHKNEGRSCDICVIPFFLSNRLFGVKCSDFDPVLQNKGLKIGYIPDGTQVHCTVQKWVHSLQDIWLPSHQKSTSAECARKSKYLEKIYTAKENTLTTRWDQAANCNLKLSDESSSAQLNPHPVFLWTFVIARCIGENGNMSLWDMGKTVQA